MARLLNVLLLWLSFFAVCSLIQSCKSNSPVSPPNSTSTFDVFPLSKGLYFKYLFTSINFQNHGDYCDKWTDSGTVEYVIQDSINLSSSLRLWILSENANLLHQYYSPTDQRGGMSLDSSYWNKYASADSLYEVLSDSHMISCKSLIWNFPISNINGWSPPSFSVSRYSSSADLVFTFQSQPDYDYYYSDNTNIKVIFAKDTGLASASNAFGWGSGSTVSGGSLVTEAKLLTSSVAP